MRTLYIVEQDRASHPTFARRQFDLREDGYPITEPGNNIAYGVLEDQLVDHGWEQPKILGSMETWIGLKTPEQQTPEFYIFGTLDKRLADIVFTTLVMGYEYGAGQCHQALVEKLAEAQEELESIRHWTLPRSVIEEE